MPSASDIVEAYLDFTDVDAGNFASDVDIEPVLHRSWA